MTEDRCPPAATAAGLNPWSPPPPGLPPLGMCRWWNLNGKFSQTSQRRRRNDLDRITRFFTWRLACLRRLYARAGRVQKRGTRSIRAGWRTSAQKTKKQKKPTFWFVRKWDFSPETAEFLLSAQHDANISDGLNLHAHFAHEHLKVFDPDQRAPAGIKGKATEQTYLMSSAQSRSCLGDASTRLCASVRDHCWDSEGVAQRRRHLTDFSSEKRSNC